jgi:hypothetical protein
MPVPMRQTGEIEAQVEAVNGDLRRPLPGIEVVLVDPGGKHAVGRPWKRIGLATKRAGNSHAHVFGQPDSDPRRRGIGSSTLREK